MNRMTRIILNSFYSEIIRAAIDLSSSQDMYVLFSMKSNYIILVPAGVVEVYQLCNDLCPLLPPLVKVTSVAYFYV